MTKMTHKQRPKVLLRQIPAEKKPYVVRGMSQTILHLTDAHAAKRFDLIPQFGRKPLEL